MAEGADGLQPGAIFAGDYQVVRTLAQGGMGSVYVVDQLSTGKSRALKLMRPEVAGDADSRRRFELEARVGARIESDHVVEIHSAGVDAGTPYIVMELLDGEDLATRMNRTGALDTGEAREVFEQLCHAVAAAHVAGIVHRDLKPENVFLARSKRAGDASRTNVKVLDFGIAKLVAESQTRGGTMGMIGTPMWMAPEQTELGKITPAADVWALGLMLYYVLTGQSYWLTAGKPEATITQLLKEVVMGPLPAASARARAQGVAGSISPEVDTVLARCLVREPAVRYQDARQLWDAIGMALTPPSARILGAAPAIGLDRTFAEQPSRPGGTEVMGPSPFAPTPPPRAGVPAFAPESFAHDPGMSRSWDRRLVLVPIALVVMFGLQRCAVMATRSSSERRAAQGAPDNLLPTSGTGPTRGATPVAPSKECRLCTTAVVATGPISQQSALSSLESALPTLDQQCLSAKRRRPSAATTTIAFVVRDGRASNRRVESSTAPNSTDECLAHALADVGFPGSSEETQMTVTFSYNSAR